MYRQYIRRNITSVSIILFVALFTIIQYIEPRIFIRKGWFFKKIWFR